MQALVKTALNCQLVILVQLKNYDKKSKSFFIEICKTIVANTQPSCILFLTFYKSLLVFFSFSILIH